jgi:hypothetical protein
MRYERSLSTLKEVAALPCVLLSCGAWMVIAFFLDHKIRYQQWQTRRLEAQTKPLEVELDRYQHMTKDLERHIAGDE